MNKIEVSATVTFSRDADEFDEPRRRWETPFGFSSGKEAALLPLPPLRTGHDGFPSSGSSRV
jgi:hypothetical protein